MKRLVITGASGFLGSAIMRMALADGLDVRGLGRRPNAENWPDYVICNLSDVKCLAECFAGASCVIHAAGLAHQFGAKAAEAPFEEVNVTGTKNVMRAAIEAGVEHVVLISSVSVYGPHGRAVCNENCPCHPLEPYAISKLEAERCAIEMASGTSTRLTILRPATIYGEGDPGNLLKLIKAVDSGRFVWVGTGKNRKSLVHKDDVARACLAAAQSALPAETETPICNVAAPAHTMKQIVREIARALGKSEPHGLVSDAIILSLLRGLALVPPLHRRASNVGNSIQKWLADDVYDGTKFNERYGFKSQISLRDGIEREITWFKAQTKDDAEKPSTSRDGHSTAQERPSYLQTKAALDSVLAVALLPLLLPVMGIAALLIRLDSPGPAIYKQERVGQNGEVFTIFKFRSMHIDTPVLSTEDMQKQPRKPFTRLGPLLRKTNIDELPQLFNILKGEMSFVGPRPALPTQIDVNELRAKLGVEIAKPGITGLAQVSGRDDLDTVTKVNHDANYCKRMSLFLDLKIVLRTFEAIFSARGNK